MEKEQSFDIKKLERDNKEFLKRKEKLNNIVDKATNFLSRNQFIN